MTHSPSSATTPPQHPLQQHQLGEPILLTPEQQDALTYAAEEALDTWIVDPDTREHLGHAIDKLNTARARRLTRALNTYTG